MSPDPEKQRAVSQDGQDDRGAGARGSGGNNGTEVSGAFTNPFRDDVNYGIPLGLHKLGGDELEVRQA